MASSYFTVPSFARAKRNKEELEKTNPQEPVLKDEDEKFLNSQISSEETKEQSRDVPATKITDDGEEKEASEEEQRSNSIVVPETQPETGDGAQDEPSSGDGVQGDEESSKPTSQDDATKEEPGEIVKAKKAKKKASFDLPSQEDAEAATRGFNEKGAEELETSQPEKRTWASYLPNVRPGSRKGATDTSTSDSEQPTSPENETSQEQPTQTWTQTAATYIPSMPALTTSFRPKSRDKDSAPSPVYNEDGTINETATKEKEEREVSVLLDNLNLSSINNRVFAFSAETQNIYNRFALVLKDIINGAPTAYEDMDKLMKEAGPKLEKQFQSMPPFVQTLVKSLPMRLGSSLGPELMAAASEKPGGDMKASMEAASQPGAADSGDVNLASASTAGSEEVTETAEDGTQKKKRRIPAMKGLVSSKSSVATMLRSVVNFLQTRFPLLASTTNVVMSLAVFSKFSLFYKT